MRINSISLAVIAVLGLSIAAIWHVERSLNCGLGLAGQYPGGPDDVSLSLRFCAITGDPEAMAWLGLMYTADDWVQPDDIWPRLSKERMQERGWELLRRAAATEKTVIPYADMGNFYRSGAAGVERDFEKAVQYYRWGIELGDPVSAYALARFILDPETGPADDQTAVDEALALFRLYSDRYVPSALIRHYLLYECADLTPQEIRTLEIGFDGVPVSGCAPPNPDLELFR